MVNQPRTQRDGNGTGRGAGMPFAPSFQPSFRGLRSSTCKSVSVPTCERVSASTCKRVSAPTCKHVSAAQDMVARGTRGRTSLSCAAGVRSMGSRLPPQLLMSLHATGTADRPLAKRTGRGMKGYKHGLYYGADPGWVAHEFGSECFGCCSRWRWHVSCHRCARAHCC